ncbi:MAG: hypothetical protein VX737_05940 [Pseudomonadota bacterium]|nr:hypothetical protein [Pseudomonadota bacterium]
MFLYFRCFYIVLLFLNAVGVNDVSSLSDRINGTWCTQSDEQSFLLREPSSKMGSVEDFKSSELCVTFNVVQSSLDSGTGKSYEAFTAPNIKSNPRLTGHFEEGILYDPGLFSYFTTPGGDVEIHAVDMADKSHYELYLLKGASASGSDDRLQGVVFEHGDSHSNKREGLSGHLLLVKKQKSQPSFNQQWQKLYASAHQ